MLLLFGMTKVQVQSVRSLKRRKSMNYPTWRPGDSGLIYLPAPGTVAGQKNRPYYILDIDGIGRCKIREGPMSWTEANERLVELALSESVLAFSAPEEKTIAEHRSQGRMFLDP